jgi:hypothetical protein
MARLDDGTGTDVMILKIYSPKHLAKILACFTQTTGSFCKNLIITLFLRKTPILFAENWHKSQKIVIITSTPGLQPQEPSSESSATY